MFLPLSFKHPFHISWPLSHKKYFFSLRIVSSWQSTVVRFSIPFLTKLLIWRTEFHFDVSAAVLLSSATYMGLLRCQNWHCVELRFAEAGGFRRAEILVPWPSETHGLRSNGHWTDIRARTNSRRLIADHLEMRGAGSLVHTAPEVLMLPMPCIRSPAARILSWTVCKCETTIGC